MALEYNEGKACDAVIRVIEARLDAARQNIRFPEKENHCAPIELTCDIAGKFFAIEHTGIEPFSGHMRMESEANWRYRPIEQVVADKLPPDEWFELAIPLGALDGLKGQALIDAQATLACWTIVTAPTLPIASFHEYLPSNRWTKPAGLDFEVRLNRFAPVVGPGRFTLMHVVSQVDQPKLRKDRLRQACEKKFPKLEWWRNDTAARTIFILEDNDIQLTNPERIFSNLKDLKTDFKFWPDEIYLVCTFIDDPWYVHPLWIDSLEFYQINKIGTGFFEFSPKNLVDLTRP